MKFTSILFPANASIKQVDTATIREAYQMAFPYLQNMPESEILNGFG